MRGALPEEIAEANLESLRIEVKRLGYASLYDAVLQDAKMENEEFCKFVESGGLNKLHEEYARVRKIRTSNLDRMELRRMLCEPALKIMKREWKDLTNETALFKTSLNTFSPAYIESFTFDSVFTDMQEHAPVLISLLQRLCEKPHRTASDPGNDEDEDDEQYVSATEEEKQSFKHRAKQRHIVMALSILGNQVSRRFNAVQGRLGYFLYASKTSKSVISVLNKLGICPSYKALVRAIKATGAAARHRLQQICLLNQMFWLSYDNLTHTNHVKLETMFSKSDFNIITPGYLAIPHASRSQPLFPHSHFNYGNIYNLDITDFLPSLEAKNTMGKSIKSLAWKILTNFSESFKKPTYKVPNLDFPMPVKFEADNVNRCEIVSLPTYPYNEGITAEMIKIIEQIATDIGLSDQQRMEIKIWFKGDFATVERNRYLELYPNTDVSLGMQ
jgi:hypothetical protein